MTDKTKLKDRLVSPATAVTASRVDYSGVDRAPVLTCFLVWDGRVLILRRSAQVGTYRGKWGAVAGYLDEPLPIQEQAYREIEEEVGVPWQEIRGMRMAPPYEVHDPDLGRTWLVHPILVVLKRAPTIRLDREHTEHRWIAPEELVEYDTVPRLADSLRRALGA